MAQTGGTPQSHRAQGVECLRCAPGPFYHGPHKRDDPSCILHGCTSTDPAEVRAYLKQKTFEKAVAEALQKQPDQQDREPPPQPAAQSGSTEALCKRCLRGSSSHCKHVATATNCILLENKAQVKALLWQHEVQLASEEARGQQPGAPQQYWEEIAPPRPVPRLRQGKPRSLCRQARLDHRPTVRMPTSTMQTSLLIRLWRFLACKQMFPRGVPPLLRHPVATPRPQ